ncbi:MAG: metal ABC transporter permease, partial [Gemmatimonadetes bacterium]|nr:metal ABC transporter permease [Gemmatimonadota bacterium]
MVPEQEIQWIAAVTAAACALPGVFLVLRRMALMSDAISHAILLGIVVGFFVTENIASPLLVGAAALTGVLTVSLVELLDRTRLVREDAAIGLVFPALFSIGVILIARFAGSVHLDIDAVLLGELAFAPFNRLVVNGVDLGPRILWLMSAILLLNAAFIAAFYKELKLTTFDAALASALGFAPGVVHYAFMTLVSVTAVGAFDAVGSILVVALMIAPPAAAYLLTDRLPRMIGLSVAIGVASSLSGYWMSYLFDVSIAGSMATMTGVAFGLVFLLAPERGLLALARRRARQRWEFAQTMLAIHLMNHENSPDAAEENRESHLHAHLRWEQEFARRV